MHLEGNPEVLSRLFLKQDLEESGDERHHAIRPGIIALAGMLRGADGGGRVTALEEFGLTEVFTAGALGISTGKCILDYFLACQSRLGTSIYYEECTQKEFCSLRRGVVGLVNGTDWMIDIRWLIDEVMRSEKSRKRLNQAAIYRSRVPLYAGVTCILTGEGLIIDSKSVKPDILAATEASISFPGLSFGPYVVEGRYCMDGSGSLPFPAPRFMSEFRPTDLLILANCPKNRRGKKDYIEWILSRVIFRNCSRAARSAFLRRNEQARADMAATIEQKNCRVAICWMDNSVGKFERNPDKVRTAAMLAECHMSELLEIARHNMPAFT